MDLKTFETFARISPNGLLLVDGDGVVLSANRLARKALGIDENDSELGHFSRFFADQASVSNHLRSARRTTSPIPETLALKGGGDRVVRLDSSRVSKPGEPARVLIRIRQHEDSISEFTVLREKIQALGAEIHARRRTQVVIESQKEALAGILAGEPFRETFDPFLDSVRNYLGGGVALVIIGQENDTSHYMAESGVPGELADLPAADLMSSFADQHETVICDASDSICGPALESSRFAEMMTIPLRSGDDDDLMGVLCAFFAGPNQITSADASEIVQLAARTATIALESRMSEQKLKDSLEAERIAREKAEESDRLKSEFVAMVSHELRTPLTSILGWIRLLTPEATPEELKMGLATIERSARTQAQLVEDLLDASRLNSGRMEVQRVPVNLVPVVRSAAVTIRPLAESRDVSVTASLPDSVLPVSGDPHRLHQIVWNLLTNAVKFSPLDGEVTVSLRGEGEKAVISVHNEGEGISEEFLPRMFGRFTQEESVYTRTKGGLGLGLSIVRDLVDLHHGEIRVESAPGKGATFIVEFPLIQGEFEQPPISQSLDELDLSGTELSGVNVVVVEDDEPTLEFLRLLLVKAGAEVDAFESVEDAMPTYLERKPDVLLTDIGLPGASGNDFIRAVRSSPSGVPKVAIAISAYLQEADGFDAIDEGFHTFMSKPIAPELLISEIQLRLWHK